METFTRLQRTNYEFCFLFQRAVFPKRVILKLSAWEIRPHYFQRDVTLVVARRASIRLRLFRLDVNR